MVSPLVPSAGGLNSLLDYINKCYCWYSWNWLIKKELALALPSLPPSFPPSYRRISYLEIYNEVMYDLLSTLPDSLSPSNPHTHPSPSVRSVCVCVFSSIRILPFQKIQVYLSFTLMLPPSLPPSLPLSLPSPPSLPPSLPGRSWWCDSEGPDSENC